MNIWALKAERSPHPCIVGMWLSDADFFHGESRQSITSDEVKLMLIYLVLPVHVVDIQALEIIMSWISKGLRLL